MSIKVESTTDSPEAVTAALGGLAKQESKVEETKQSASANETEGQGADETQEESETSETLEASDESETQDSDESQEDESDESKDEKKSPKKNGFKKRIDKLSKRAAAAEQEKEYWKAEALKAKTAQEKPESKPEKEIIVGDDEPKQDDFESHAEYIKALGTWSFNKAKKEAAAKEKEEKLKAEHKAKAETFSSKINEFKEKHEDFDELMEEAEDVPGNDGVASTIYNSEIGPALMYELAKNKKEYARIAALDPYSAAHEVKKIEERLLKKSETPPEKKLTKAPPPIKPVSSVGTAKVTKSPESMSYQEFKRAREAGQL